MKRILCLLLSLGIIFALCGCTEDVQPEATTESIYGTYLLRGMQVKTLEEIEKVQDEVNPDYPHYGKYLEGNALFEELEVSWEGRRFSYAILHPDNTITYSLKGGAYFGELKNKEIYFPEAGEYYNFKYDVEGETLTIDDETSVFYFEKVSDDCEKFSLPREGKYTLCSVLYTDGNVFIPEEQLIEQGYLPEEHFVKVSVNGIFADITYYEEKIATAANKQMLIDLTNGQYAYSFSENYFTLLYDGKVLTYRLEK